MDKPIHLFKASLPTENILNDLRNVINSGWVGLGKKTEEFEKAFAKEVGAKYAVAVNSCTSALHLAGRIFNIEPGDVVPTTSMTFVATNQVLLYQQAIPAFIDIDPGTFCVDIKKLKRFLELFPEVKTIVVVHYGGTPMEMTELYEYARTRGLSIIEDAAHACGARYRDGNQIGSNPYEKSLTCFSFHAVKNLPISDGGMVTTNDHKIYERLRALRWFGIDKSTHERTVTADNKGYNWQYNISEVGYKYHANDITSTIGLHSLKQLYLHNEKRNYVWEYYYARLNKIVDFVGKDVGEKGYSSRHLAAIKVDAEIRDSLIEYMNQNNIFPGVHYYPNHLYKIFDKFEHFPLEVTKREWQRLICLPCHVELSNDNLNRICSVIEKYILEICHEVKV